jgi:hypothetical protein
VAKASIAVYVTQASDILSDLPAELTAHSIIAVDYLRDAAKLIFGEFAGLCVLVYLGLFQNLLGGMSAYTIDIGHRDPYRLLIWNINANNTRHTGSSFTCSSIAQSLQSALALLMPGVYANHPHNASAADNLAILTYTFY